jgi:hypothetical protein
MPPVYVKPYVKRQKNDAADAEAICEAVTRVNMRFVPTKTPEQQSCLTPHRTRLLFIRQQTAVIDAIRGVEVLQRQIFWRRHLDLTVMVIITIDLTPIVFSEVERSVAAGGYRSCSDNFSMISLVNSIPPSSLIAVTFPRRPGGYRSCSDIFSAADIST